MSTVRVKMNLHKTTRTTAVQFFGSPSLYLLVKTVNLDFYFNTARLHFAAPLPDFIQGILNCHSFIKFSLYLMYLSARQVVGQIQD